MDLVVFDGLAEGRLRRIVFVEVKTGGAGLTGRERILVLGLALEDSCAGDRARLLEGLPRQQRWAWRLVGARRYRRAVVRLRGEPPAA